MTFEMLGYGITVFGVFLFWSWDDPFVVIAQDGVGHLCDRIKLGE